MKKKKVTKLSLKKNTISSFDSNIVKGGSYTWAPPCISNTEPPDSIEQCSRFDCGGTGPGTGQSNTCPTNQTCGNSCVPNCNPGSLNPGCGDNTTVTTR
ncbi:hypothetical protein [Kordia sp.]|uniref:hypothetical protein n=1 Tax=Kordia sp. TaxID=1965332 RepID=UPI0025BBC267|nr:hypothetical protein [Kordia sp.]MCH2193562.1 hypothetical protein [Kordia sp.]